MSYKVIIAEKPSVAAAIAKIVGATTQYRKGPTGYVEGGGYRVTWAFGHLVGLQSPEQMGYTAGELPMIPRQWTTRILGRRDASGKEVSDPMIDAQMKVLEQLFREADSIVVATDAGREGELIFRYIYEYLGSRTRFDRLWISSLTGDAIRAGMAGIRPGSEFDALSDAAHARSQADWLVGFNGSRALRLATGFKGKLSLGRVQTPTLGMICSRYEQFKSFVPTPYWQIAADTEKDATPFRVLTQQRYATEDAATADFAKVRAAGQLQVDAVERRHVTTRPPLLFDLTELQRAANGRYGLTADETLRAAQSLYEKKYITYPRTGSRYIPEDVLRTIPELLRKMEGYGGSASGLAQHASALAGRRLCRRSVDDGKVTDHHALLPTGVVPEGLSGAEKKVYELIVARTLEAFGENAEADVTNVILSAGGVAFKAHGSVTTHAGWKGVLGEEAADDGGDDEPSGRLPELCEGDILPVTKTEVLQKADKPQPIYTEKTLLGEMQTCGRHVEDEEAREAMKDVGLGTPATRAATIEALITRHYILREGKKLVPTDLGLQIWHMVQGRKIADVQVTGEWERDLALVEQGKTCMKDFMQRIEAFVRELIDDLLRNCKPIEGVSASGEPVRTCPVCHRPMKNLKFSVSCLAEAGGCGLKIPREINGKKLPESALDALAAGKATALLKGFTSKAGKKFDARLKVENSGGEAGVPVTGRVVFAFDDAAPKIGGEDLPCPCCGGTMKAVGPKMECGCGFTLWFKQCGVTLTEKQVATLLSGKKTAVKGMTSPRTGKKFDASLVVNKEARRIDFVFDKNQKR